LTSLDAQENNIQNVHKRTLTYTMAHNDVNSPSSPFTVPLKASSCYFNANSSLKVNYVSQFWENFIDA